MCGAMRLQLDTVQVIESILAKEVEYFKQYEGSYAIEGANLMCRFSCSDEFEICCYNSDYEYQDDDGIGHCPETAESLDSIITSYVGLTKGHPEDNNRLLLLANHLESLAAKIRKEISI